MGAGGRRLARDWASRSVRSRLVLLRPRSRRRSGDMSTAGLLKIAAARASRTWPSQDRCCLSCRLIRCQSVDIPSAPGNQNPTRTGLGGSDAGGGCRICPGGVDARNAHGMNEHGRAKGTLAGGWGPPCSWVRMSPPPVKPPASTVTWEGCGCPPLAS